MAWGGQCRPHCPQIRHNEDKRVTSNRVKTLHFSPTPRARRKRANGPRPRRAIPDPASFRQGQARAKGKAHPRARSKPWTKVEGARKCRTKRETPKAPKASPEPPSGRHNATTRPHTAHTPSTRDTDPRRTAHAPGRGACAAAARAVAGRGGGTQSTEPRAGTHSRAAGTECREFRFSRERAREISSRQVGVCDVEHERGALRLAVLPDLVLE